jgi:chromosome partitioning protein
LVDVDTHGRLHLWMNVRPQGTLYDVLVQTPRAQSAITTLRPNLDLVASGNGDLSGYVSARSDQSGLRTRVTAALRSLARSYDYALLDCGPGLDALAVAVCFASDEVIIPVTTGQAGSDGLAEQVRIVEDLQHAGHPLRITAVVPTMVEPTVREHAYWLQEYQRQIDMLTPPIRKDIKLFEQPRTGKTIFELAPRSRAAADYAALVRRIDGA